jgi:hypothetical protein
MILHQFTEKFIQYIRNNGNDPKNWYSGITNAIEQRFNEHSVNRKDDLHFYADAQTESNARYAEKFLIESLGTKGDTGGGDSTTTWVYIYRIYPHTRQ